GGGAPDVRAGCSAASLATCSRIRGPRQMRKCFLPCCNPVTRSWDSILRRAGTSPTAPRANIWGKWFKPVPYGVRRDDHRIDMEEVARLAREHKPKLIIAGGSAYPRIIDFRGF